MPDQEKIGSRPACVLAEADTLHCNSSRYTIVQLDATLRSRGGTWNDARSRPAWVKWRKMENPPANGPER